MGWFGEILVKRKKSKFLTSLSPPQLLHPSKWLPSSFHCYKAKSDLNNQPIFFHIAKKGLSCSLISICQHIHKPASLWLVCVCVFACMCLCTRMGAVLMRTRGQLMNWVELVTKSKKVEKKRETQRDERKQLGRREKWATYSRHRQSLPKVVDSYAGGVDVIVSVCMFVNICIFLHMCALPLFMSFCGSIERNR